MSNFVYEKHGHVRLIMINRPDKMNSLDLDANDEMVEIWNEFDNDDDARVAVVTGAGDKAFCAGADLKTYTLNFARSPAPLFRKKYTNGPGFGGITRNLDIDKPILAAINGYAISGGFELALACDIRFCSPNAEFALQDAKWGFHACDGGLVRLPQIIGMGHAMEIILSGERVNAEHAYRIGLVNRIYEQAELLTKSLDYAQMLASRAPLSHRFAKEMIRRSMGMTMEEALKAESRSFKDVAMTHDLEEGVTSFKERREAKFKGE
jgi:enoyl-CoA hydratase/carnithine racemase